MYINIVKHRETSGDLNSPVEVDEQDTEVWMILYDTGVGAGNFDIKEEALTWVAENPLNTSANLVQVKVSVKQVGRVGN